MSLIIDKDKNESMAAYLMSMEWCALTVFSFLTVKEVANCELVCDEWYTIIYNFADQFYLSYYMEHYALAHITKKHVHLKINFSAFRHGIDNPNHSKYDLNSNISCWSYNDGKKCKQINHYIGVTKQPPKGHIKHALVHRHYITSVAPSLNIQLQQNIKSLQEDRKFLDNIEQQLEDLSRKRQERIDFKKSLSFYAKCGYLATSSVNKVKKVLGAFKKEKKKMKKNKDDEGKQKQIKRIVKLLKQV